MVSKRSGQWDKYLSTDQRRRTLKEEFKKRTTEECSCSKSNSNTHTKQKKKEVDMKIGLDRAFFTLQRTVLKNKKRLTYKDQKFF